MKIHVLVALASFLVAPVALAKDKEPITAIDGDYSHITSFKLKDESLAKLLTDHSAKGWRLVAVTGQLPQEIYFEKSTESYEYKVESKMALTTTKELKQINEGAKDGWKFRAVISEVPTYSFIYEKPAKAKSGG